MNHHPRTMNNIYDIAGIGIGPFNLGFAALSHHLPALKPIFFDKQESFDWHPGLMFDFATLQVPFFADLVTGADPCSPFSFLSYLKQNNRLYQFAIKEDQYISRYEYNDYCRWVAARLPSLQFSSEVQSIEYAGNKGCYRLLIYREDTKRRQEVFARKLLLGCGAVPFVPAFIDSCNQQVFHASEWLYRKQHLEPQKGICIIGSGQSCRRNLLRPFTMQ